MNSEMIFRNLIRGILNAVPESVEIEEGFSRIDIICEEINRLGNWDAIWNSKEGRWEISE